MALLQQKPLSVRMKQSPAQIAVSILGGLVIVFLFIGLSEVWKFPTSFNASLGAYFALQIITIFPIILLVLGGLIARSPSTGIKNQIEALIAGALSGLVTALCIVLLTGIRYFYLKGMYNGITLIGQLMLVLLCSIILQAVGAFFWFRWQQRSTTNICDRNTFISGKKGVTLSIILIIVILIPLIVLPPAWAYDGIRSGSIQREWWYIKWDSVSVNQSDGNTLLLTLYLKEDPLIDQYWKKPYCLISLDGNDISNQSSIRNHGFPDTIDPPEGLSFSQHSRVVLKGLDFNPMRNPAGHLEVYKIVPYRTGDKKILLFDYWIGKKGEGI